jgi:hypothetical protein
MTYHEWMVGGAVLAGICAVFLAVAIKRLVEIYRASPVAAVPLGSQKEIKLDSTGAMVLHIEGPQLSSGFRGLQYKLVQRSTGLAVALESILFRTTVSGVRNARVSILSFTVATPGRYILHVDGLSPDIRIENHRLVITHDSRSRTMLTLLAIVTSALGLIGGGVLAAIAYFFKTQG